MRESVVFTNISSSSRCIELIIGMTSLPTHLDSDLGWILRFLFRFTYHVPLQHTSGVCILWHATSSIVINDVGHSTHATGILGTYH